MKFDLHLHTSSSNDALTKPETLVKAVKKAGLDGFAITDHNNCDSWSVLSKLCKKQNLVFVKGEEIKAVEDGKTIGEIIGLFMNKFLESAPPAELFDALKKQGALSVVAHPFDTFRHEFKRVDLFPKADALEVFNSRTILNRFNKKAMSYVKENEMAFTAGSDAHIPEEVGNAFLECNAQNGEELRKAILKRKATVVGKLASPLVHGHTTLTKFNILKPR